MPDCDCVLHNILLENLGLCSLRIAKVHHFVEQLVYDDKVVPNALFFQLLEVFCENLYDFV